MVRFAPPPVGPGVRFRRVNTGSNNSMKQLLRGLTAAVFFTFVVAGFADIETGFVPDPEDPAIAYGTRPTTDRISVLNREIESGSAQLKFDGERAPQPAHPFLKRLRGDWLGAQGFYRDSGTRLSAGRHQSALLERWSWKKQPSATRQGYGERRAQSAGSPALLHARAGARREATIHAPRRMPTVPQFQQCDGCSGHVGAQPIHGV